MWKMNLVNYLGKLSVITMFATYGGGNQTNNPERTGKLLLNHTSSMTVKFVQLNKVLNQNQANL